MSDSLKDMDSPTGLDFVIRSALAGGFAGGIVSRPYHP